MCQLCLVCNADLTHAMPAMHITASAHKVVHLLTLAASRHREQQAWQVAMLLFCVMNYTTIGLVVQDYH